MLIGADLALKHGALVTSTGELLFAYNDQKGMDVSSEELYILALRLVAQTPFNSTVVIDWDRTAGTWGGGRSPVVAVLITQLVSFYGALAQARRACDVHYVTPELVRYCLGLPPMCHKSSVHEHVQPIMPVSLPNDIEGDNWDAYILCHVFECASR